MSFLFDLFYNIVCLTYVPKFCRKDFVYDYFFSLSQRVAPCSKFDFWIAALWRVLQNHGSLSVCLSAQQQFSIFIRNRLLEISDFLDRGRWLEYLKSVRALFSRKIHFSQKLGKNCPKWHRNSVFWIFGKFLSLVFLGIFQNENYYCHWYFTINQICGKILVLELWAKMLLANRTAGFFKM